MAQRPSPAEDNAVLQDYVGLSESQARDLAQSRDTPFRVVTRDGVSQRVTFDFVRGRINADVRDGVVVTYTVEGAKQRTQKVPQGEDSEPTSSIRLSTTSSETTLSREIATVQAGPLCRPAREYHASPPSAISELVSP